MEKAVNTRKKVKLHIKKGDLVRVISGKGAKEKAEGRVLKIVKKKNKYTGEVQYRAIVEGLRMVVKHEKKGVKGNQEGSIKEMEATIHVSNLMLVDPKSGSPTRIGRRKAEKGWVRVSKKSGEIIK